MFSLKCREVVEFLDRYLTSELPESQRREFDWHLRLCGSCRAYLRTYRDTISLEKRTFAGEDAGCDSGIPEELVAAILAARRA